ncbi:unnamed protein product [Ophioblennius macclurei]
MDGPSQRSKTTSSCFGNTNTRLGSKLPPGVCQPPQFAKRPWERTQQRGVGLCHIPHIRNPQLRQYYLQGTSWDLSRTLATNVSSDGSTGSSLHVQKEEATPAHPEQKLDPSPKPKSEVEVDQSPSPEAEYDKLLDVEEVPMPDGQLYLLALPPECCQGEGPEATPYLKLFCSYITDRKGVISGILLVTSNKIFFDPSKTHPLVREHGCEEYFLSCSVDNLQSVCFFSDISDIHFNPSQQRRKEKNIFQKLKSFRSHMGTLPNQWEESHPAQSDVCGLAASLKHEEVERSPLTFCCGVQEAANPNPTKTDLPSLSEAYKSFVKDETSAAPKLSGGGPAALMFVRLRVQPCSERQRRGGLHFGPDKLSSRRDAWLALSQESADQLQAYLKLCRPHLQTDRDPNEEEFVLVEDKEKEQMSRRHSGSGDDWEMVSMEDSEERLSLVPERDPEGLYRVVESSHILEASHVRELCQELPARTVGQTWQLTYSTSRHGASLKSLYRKLQATDSPVLIVIKDALDEIFGAFLSHPLRPSEEFYGTGETFLFMLHPRFKCFKWTGENSFFIKGYMDSFAIGGGSGHFGLWVDENLYLGHSSPCYTFNNCCLSETNDFRVMELEVWTFS